MRKFKRLTLTLALLLTAVTGAWAQSYEAKVFDVPASWASDETYLSAADLPKDFVQITNEEAKALAVPNGNVLLIYDFEGENVKALLFMDGTLISEDEAKEVRGTFIQYQTDSNVKICYTAPAVITEWSLTSDETGKTWTLAKMPASNVELQVEYEPTKVTIAANDNAMGTVEVAAQSKVEWTADTWKGWTQNTKEYTVDDITMTSSESARIQEYTSEDEYNHSLGFFVRRMVDDATVTFSTTGDPFSRIEFTMIDDYKTDWNPGILPLDNWTFEGKSAKWEGEATKSLTLQSCTTFVSKITFYKGGDIPDGVTVNGDGTFTVAKTATVTLKATPKEGYKFLYWEDDKNNTNPVREVTIESGMAEKTYRAVFAEITYNVTFVEGTNLNEWSATPATEVKKGDKVDIKYTGSKKVIGVKVEKKEAAAKTLAEATAEDYGKVVCAAGHLHDAKTAVPDGCTAVGILGKVTETGHGLILALKNATEQNCNTINGWTSASYAGTTLKVLPDDAARGANLSSYGTLGETTVSNWAVAQQSDYDAIFTNLGSMTGDSMGKTYDGNVNAFITTGVGGTEISGNYWSPTEDGVIGAWSFNSVFWSRSGKSNSYNVRPVLGF